MEKIKYFTQKELKKLFRSIKRQKDYPFVLRDLTMFNVGYLCGLRVSGIGKLHQEHFSEPGGELFCMRLKNSISNIIRLDDRRKNLLKKHIREHQVKNGDPFFISRKGNPISSRQLDRLMKHYAGKALYYHPLSLVLDMIKKYNNHRIFYYPQWCLNLHKKSWG